VLQLFHDGVVFGAVHEVVDRDVLGAGCLVPGTRGEVLVGDDEVFEELRRTNTTDDTNAPNR